MSQWWTISLRCWVAFIALTNFGAALRCFADEEFLHSKFLNPALHSIKSNDGPVLERVYGFWSLTNGIILLCSFFFIEEKRFMALSMAVIVLHMAFFFHEGYIFQTLQIRGPIVYPFALNGLTLIWLMMTLAWPSGNKLREDVDDENEVLRRRFQFKNLNKKSN